MVRAAEGANLAHGKPYTLTPEPNYPYCTEAGDREQLTDGLYVDPAQPQLWVNEGCVGWRSREPVEVVVDLQAVCPIAAVAISSAAGPGAEVYLPDVLVAVSEDGADFRVVQRLETSALPQTSRAALRLDGLRTRGRYVLVQLWPPHGTYVFAEEVQVLEGAHDAGAVTLPEERALRVQVDVLTEAQKRLLRALDRLEACLARGPSAAGHRGVLDALRREIGAAPTSPQVRGKFRTMDPALASRLSGAVRELQRGTARRLYPAPRVAVWPTSPWAEIAPGDFPAPGADDARELPVVMGQTEYESAALVVTNLSDAALAVPVEVRLPERGWPAVTVALRQAVFVDTPEGFPLADALPLLEEPLKLPPWESRMLWLALRSRDAAPGQYRAELVVGTGTEQERAVPLVLTVLPVAIPAEVPLATYSWQYVDSIPPLTGFEEAAIADLAAHYTNVTVLSKNTLPRPSRERGDTDEQGNLLRPLDFGALDRWVKRTRPIAGRGLTWFPSMTFTKPADEADPEFRTYAECLRQLVAHLKTLGLGYGDFFVYPVDESILADFLSSARAIRAVDPQVRIYANPMMRDATDVLQAAAPYVDLWCPAHDVRYPEQLQVLRDTGKPVWSYWVGRRTLCPYGAYRLAPWRAFQMGATGCGFWCYAVGADWTNRDLWHESALLYAVIYTPVGAPPGISTAESIIPSRRWEAWREGVEDYVYLDALRRAIATAERDKRPQPQVQAARETLAAAIREVLAAPADLARAERHRQQVMSAIVSLETP
jgi:hypothetical protein